MSCINFGSFHSLKFLLQKQNIKYNANIKFVEEYKNYNCASYEIRNFLNKEGTKLTTVRSYRMVKIFKDTKYVSPIHEMLTPVLLPEKILPVYVHHYGYAFDTQEERRNHSERNRIILREVLEKDPKDFRLWLQMIQEYCAAYEYKEALKLSLEVIDKMKEEKHWDDANTREFGWIVNNVVSLYKIINDNSKAYEYGKECLQLEYINEATKINLYYRMVVLCVLLDKKDECLEYIYNFENSYKILIKDDVKRRKESILEQEEIIDEKTLAGMYVQAIKMCYLFEDERINVFVNRLVKTNTFDRTDDELKLLIKCLLKEEQESVRNRIIKHLYRNEKNKHKVIAFVKSDIWNEEDKKKLMFIFGNDEVYLEELEEYHIYWLYKSGNRKMLQDKILSVLGSKEDILSVSGIIYEIIRESKIDISALVEAKNMNEWRNSCLIFVHYSSEKELERMLEIFKNTETGSFKISYLKMRCLEKLMQRKDIQNCVFETLLSYLKEYFSAAWLVYSSLYREENFYNEHIIFMPKCCQYMIKVESMIKGEISELECAKVLREAAEVYPEMSEFCKAFILRMKEKMSMKTEEQNEFTMLGNMIKEKIRMFIAQRDYIAARQTLFQLERIMPKDKEIADLKEELSIYCTF